MLQEDRRSEDLPFGSRGGMAIHYDFPVDGEYLIKVRLQRQYQDYLKGMGWPQQLDVRLDGKLLKRFTVGGAGKGRPPRPATPAMANRALPAIPNGKTTCSSPATPGWKCAFRCRRVRAWWAFRSCGRCGNRKAFRNRLQRGRVIANDQVYMDYANVGSVQIGGPYEVQGTREGHASRRAIFVCQPPKAVVRRARLRRDDSFAEWPGWPIGVP